MGDNICLWVIGSRGLYLIAATRAALALILKCHKNVISFLNMATRPLPRAMGLMVVMVATRFSEMVHILCKYQILFLINWRPP